MACGWCPPTGRNICGGTAARPMTLSQGPNTMNDEPKRRAPILDHADHAAPSVFAPQALLREARRQKGIAEGQVPRFCVLDPDGDLVRYLKRGGRIEPVAAWACYHSELYCLSEPGLEVGILPCAVGSPYAVLVAEQLFASGCEFLMSITSAGQLLPVRPPPYYILIDRALRDEGTSYHYLPAARFAHAPAECILALKTALTGFEPPVQVGATWTTDAPFRETEAAIASRRAEGLLAVEMEAAALYAFAEARGRRVACFAFVTNQMAQGGADFEKGQESGAVSALALIRLVAGAGLMDVGG